MPNKDGTLTQKELNELINGADNNLNKENDEVTAKEESIKQFLLNELFRGPRENKQFKNFTVDQILIIVDLIAKWSDKQNDLFYCPHCKKKIKFEQIY